MGITSCAIILVLFQLFLHLGLHKGWFGFGYALGCQTTEREALLKLKNSLYDPANRLSSWRGDDCCDWVGVRCDNITGHICRLDMQNPQCNDPYDGFPCNTSTELRGQMLDPSLVNLTNLRYLDLTGNNFQGSTIPEFIGSMKHLRYLDLSSASFGGVLPPQLGNLTSLRSLNLSGNHFNGSVPLWLRNMRALESINLHHNSFSHVEGGSVMGIVGNLCKLKELDLSYNYIQGEIGGPFRNYPECITYNLAFLHLGSNNMTGTLPHWLGQLRNLRYLSLRGNRFHGQIPSSLGELSLLTWLYLSNNSFSGTIPPSIWRLSSLVVLDLSSNFLQGTVSNSHLTNLSSLEVLILGSNSLNLNFTSDWIPPFQLIMFDMSSCKIQGPLPQWIQTQHNLQVLYLSNNMISGEMLDWSLNVNLTVIDLSHNCITGPVTVFPSQLSVLDLSHNLLSGPLSQDRLSTSNGVVPTSLCQLRYLESLFLENNSLSGTIPTDCWENSTSLSLINLSNNALEGRIPATLFGRFELLESLDLGENKFSGEVPSFMGKNLRVLRIRGNQLGGVIPVQLCSLHRLQTLDLANNNLTGSMPHCFGHLYGMSSKQEVNVIDFPAEVNVIEVLKGVVLSYTKTLKYLVNLDLSCNGLEGSIPDELSNLSTLVGLNLSHNHLTGRIPEKIGQMRSLESLDFSNNNISGIIPASMSVLTSLSHLNLSHNKLHGEIPTGPQLQTLNDPSIYAGNLGLCGDPLPDKCTRDPRPEQGQQGEQDQADEEEDRYEKVVFCVVVILGFVTGFWGVIGTLLLKKQWRHALFQRVEDFMDYLYVQVVVRINRLKG